MASIEDNREKIESLFEVSIQRRSYEEESTNLRKLNRQKRNENTQKEIESLDRSVELYKEEEDKITKDLLENHSISVQVVIKAV